MKLLPLTHGQFAKVDDADFETFGKFKWCAVSPRDGVFYAVRDRRQSEFDLDPSLRGQRGDRLYLMREIAGVLPHIKVKPINGDALDCRRANIRTVQPSAATLSRLSAKKYIRPCFPTGTTTEEAARHPYRGLYKDFRTNKAGGVLVKSFNGGAVKFFGPYRTATQAMAKRDEQEAMRRKLGQPDIDYAVRGEAVETITAGFPCEPFSAEGKRADAPSPSIAAPIADSPSPSIADDAPLVVKYQCPKCQTKYVAKHSMCPTCLGARPAPISDGALGELI